ncbi:2-dehydropantoate 2-reductase [Pyrococcus abyssi]|uniref:2-dehydropantoate 2-reductase n=1 Tax=Pyrococcus abyssi (strain GE5 / Orsay) TaxID=272844 RepID=PANE_PYRAB|nr:2-dehydropantoate 2-reductase [Pyrococcus abyssi]Q9V0N0.1 RecName: Full=2-dehydropantoate 2-reductase; AltName: Full=Ketopantoate reductase; Short=KPR [Pyrococcus abyssi GE5]CAB49673.1 panE 2-dehydropantoate reductase (EC 1.1.1.169) [Pyrococcus abyssi GE5]CCE70155.1 TPA: 2-dehydropantoate 2-reductase [Pyrococcus abyssi GE5]
MKIYILGAGAIGSLFGGLLANAGEDVLLIGRDPHVSAINEKGLKIVGIKDLNVKVEATTRVPEEKPDLIVLATKSYSTIEALKSARHIVKGSWVLSIQNGIGNEDKIIEFGGKAIGGITTNGAMVEAPGVIKWTGKGVTIIGLYPQGKEKFIEKVADVFNSADIETHVSENIISWIWAKAIVNSAINPIGTLLEVKNKVIRENDFLLSMAMEVVKEGCRVALQNGIEFDVPPMDLFFQTLEQTRENYNSMLQDIWRGKKTEVDYINGKIVEYAKAVNLEAPMNLLLWGLIKGKEALEGKK